MSERARMPTSEEEERLREEPPDRIDFAVTSTTVVVTRFWRVDGRDVGLEGARQQPAGCDVEVRLRELEGQGYTARRWEGGARAWKGRPRPLRTAAQILARRRRAERGMRRRGEGGAVHAMDFAYDG